MLRPITLEGLKPVSDGLSTDTVVVVPLGTGSVLLHSYTIDGELYEELRTREDSVTEDLISYLLGRSRAHYAKTRIQIVT